MELTALCWQPEPPAVLILDQTRLPHEEVVLECGTPAELVAAIQRLAVRGAPLLGIAGGYGVALAAVTGADVERAAVDLAAARPTAVNLAWGVGKVLAAYRRTGPGGAVAEAQRLEAEDAAAATALASHGLALVPDHARVLTHCNTGRLVSAGPGTALGIIAAAHRAGRLSMLWIDETRPLLQGARLTAYEAHRSGWPFAVLSDGAAGSLFARGRVDLVLVGADRIAADGAVANKVGTYPLAVLAHHHGVPFVVAAPTSTIDLTTTRGADIPIEERDAAEVVEPAAPAGSLAYNPAFDVTPPEFISALVTERGVVTPVTGAAIAGHVEATAQPMHPV